MMNSADFPCDVPFSGVHSGLTAPARPVLSEREAMAICRRVMALADGSVERVLLEHQAIGVTRISRAKRRLSRDGETLTLTIQFDQGSKAWVALFTNQVDDASLKAAVAYLQRISRDRMGPPVDLLKGLEYIGPRSYPPAHVWHESTVKALAEERTAITPAILDATRAAGVSSAVFIGVSAQAYCTVRRDGIAAYGQHTDTELTVTAWAPDFKGSGWGGAAARDWTKLDPMAATHHAIDIAKRSHVVHAFEPGRRTAILGPAAVAQLVARMADSFNANNTYAGSTPFSKPPEGARVGERVFDPRISMRSDPDDSEGGYLPIFFGGFPQGPMQWVERGVLKQLAYDPKFAAQRGVSVIADCPYSVRVESVGAQPTLDEMIANCKTGIYVNRLSGIEGSSTMVSGYSRDGCFLVKDGKIDRAIKNFRFIESPFHMLNKLEMVGKTARAAMGYSPTLSSNWPLPPIIVPPMMVRDFNFIALADAV